MSVGSEAIEVACTSAPRGRWLEEAIALVIPHLRDSQGNPAQVARVSMRIVGDCEMAQLHGRYSADPTTTDVLGFVDSAVGQPIEIDIAACIDEAARRAQAYGHEVNLELLLYAVHALHHAVGFDDGSDAQRNQMHLAQDRALCAAGFAAISDPKGRVQ